MTSEQLSCECAPVAASRFGNGDGHSPATAIVEAIADAEGVAMTGLDPVYDSVNGDTINKLLTTDTDSTPGEIVVQLPIAGWLVFVRSDGEVRVCDPEQSIEPISPFDSSADE